MTRPSYVGDFDSYEAIRDAKNTAPALPFDLTSVSSVELSSVFRDGFQFESRETTMDMWVLIASAYESITGCSGPRDVLEELIACYKRSIDDAADWQKGSSVKVVTMMPDWPFYASTHPNVGAIGEVSLLDRDWRDCPAGMTPVLFAPVEVGACDDRSPELRVIWNWALEAA